MRLLFCQTSPGQGDGRLGVGKKGGEARLYQQPIRTLQEHLVNHLLMVLHLFTYLLSTTCVPGLLDPGEKVEKKTQYQHMDLFFFLRESEKQKVKKEKHSLWILRK